MKPVILIMWSVMCITIGVLLLPTCQLLQNTFLTSRAGVEVAPMEAPAQLYRVTAYCPCEKCCSTKWADGLTASGLPAVGLIVAAPKDVPFGAVLDIPGYGRAQVQDRGGAITGNRLDVLFATHEEAKQWGVKWLKVKARMESAK